MPVWALIPMASFGRFNDLTVRLTDPSLVGFLPMLDSRSDATAGVIPRTILAPVYQNVEVGRHCGSLRLRWFQGSIIKR